MSQTKTKITLSSEATPEESLYHLQQIVLLMTQKYNDFIEKNPEQRIKRAEQRGLILNLSQCSSNLVRLLGERDMYKAEANKNYKRMLEMSETINDLQNKIDKLNQIDNL